MYAFRPGFTVCKRKIKRMKRYFPRILRMPSFLLCFNDVIIKKESGCQRRSGLQDLISPDCVSYIKERMKEENVVEIVRLDKHATFRCESEIRRK